MRDRFRECSEMILTMRESVLVPPHVEKRLEQVQEVVRHASEVLGDEIDRLGRLEQRERDLEAQYQIRLQELDARNEQKEEALSKREAEINARVQKGQGLLESAWAPEKTALLEELGQWRRKALDQSAHILDVERDLAKAKQDAQEASAILALEVDRRNKIERKEQELEVQYQDRLKGMETQSRKREQELLRREAELTTRARERQVTLEKAWSQETAALLNEFGRWRENAEERLSRIMDLEKLVAAAEEKALRTSASLVQESERRNWLEQRERQLEAENRDRLADLEASFREREQALLQRGQELETRSRRTTELIETAWEEEKAVLLEELARMEGLAKQRLSRLLAIEKREAEPRNKLEQRERELEARNRQREEEFSRREAEFKARGQEGLESLESAWAREKTALLEESSRWRRKIQDQAAHALDLEKRLAQAQEDAHGASESLALEAERRDKLEQREQELEARYQDRLEELEAQNRQMEEEFSKLEAGLKARGREGQESLESGWAREKTVLLDESSQWHRKIQDQAAHALDLERRLAQAREDAHGASESLALETEHGKKLEQRERELEAQYQDRLKEMEARNRQREEELSKLEAEFKARGREGQESLEGPRERAKTPSPAPSAPPSSPTISREKQEESAHDAYGRTVALMKTSFQDTGRHPWETGGPLDLAVRHCLELLLSGNQALMLLTARSTAVNYLHAHSVNVSILSMSVGIGLGWREPALRLLGLSAATNDLAMMESLELSRESPSTEELELRLHPVEGRGLSERLGEIDRTTRRTLSEILGRDPLTAGDSPPPLSSEEGLGMASRIIALCELYETMSHPRAWRESLLPHEAVKKIVKKFGGHFDRELLKALLRRLTLFPPGSFVELSGGEIGRVVAIDPETPTLPSVEIYLHEDKTPQYPPRLLDLSKNPDLHPRRAVDETRLHVSDANVLRAFHLNRWWDRDQS